jgi:hypothetical protein
MHGDGGSIRSSFHGEQYPMVALRRDYEWLRVPTFALTLCQLQIIGLAHHLSMTTDTTTPAWILAKHRLVPMEDGSGKV